MKAEPYHWPPRGLIGEEEKAAVVRLFDEAIAAGSAPGYNGSEEQAYCREFAEYLGGGFADAVNSGTAAVFVALKALDLPAYSEVIVGCVTDNGGMMPIPMLNLIPMVADTAPGEMHPGPAEIEALITARTSAIVVAHIFGEPTDIEGIVALADRHGLPVIEDCAQAHGAKLNGKFLGTFGKLGCFSTMFGKHHCTGGQGGVVFCHDEDLANAVRRASDRGKPFGLTGQTNCVASLNLNLNDLAGAIGRVQLRKLPGIVARRQAFAAMMRERTAELKLLSLPEPAPGAEPSYWWLRACFHAAPASVDMAGYMQAIRDAGVPGGVGDYLGAVPHRQSWFTERHVFGTPGLPWTSPLYEGDRDRQFPCPNASAVLASQFRLPINESWGAAEADELGRILTALDTEFAS